jgi:chitodextrinase
LTLRCQCEGTSAIQTKKASAYAKISSAKYSGQKRNFTFDQYVEMYQAAYNTLAELNEAVPETKKVADFLARITDTKLSTAKDLKLGNFDACQQYLKTLVYNKATQDTHEWNVSGVQGGNGKGKGKGKQHRQGGGSD